MDSLNCTLDKLINTIETTFLEDSAEEDEKHNSGFPTLSERDICSSSNLSLGTITDDD